MPNNDNKRCPQCGGAIDFFGSCRRCGREWSEKLEEDELADGKPEGQQHDAIIKQQPKSKRSPRNKYTKSSSAKDPTDKYSLWRIDANNDDETEIITKRSLMRLDSRKAYNQMGLALRSHEAQKAALLWLSRLWELLSKEEQVALAPTLEHMRRGYADIKLVAQSKVNAAAKMEVEAEKEHKQARSARLRLHNQRKAKEAATVQIRPGQDTEGFGVPDLAVIDPAALEKLSHEELLELAKAQLSNIDQEKALRKRRNFSADDDTLDE